MSRENETWFGFNLSQKQAVWIFVLSLLGVIGTSYVTFSLFYPYLIMVFTTSYFTLEYFFQIMITLVPVIALNIVFLIISVYSLVKTRKIAKYYSQNPSLASPKMKEE